MDIMFLDPWCNMSQLQPRMPHRHVVPLQLRLALPRPPYSAVDRFDFPCPPWCEATPPAGVAEDGSRHRYPPPPRVASQP